MPLAELGPAHLRLLPLSYKGIKIARVLTGQWVLFAARTDAAVQHPCRCFEKEILCATQKPQGGFPFLTAFDSIIIPLLQGAFEGQFPELAIYKRIAPMIASALKQ